jgi:putative Mg2+ transporter-C (MgtC) family protein
MPSLGHEFHANLLLEMALAVVLGGAIGFERQLKDKPAGLRTHILICLGATIFTDFGQRLAAVGADPGRVAGHVAAGVGFIGAGTIMQRHGAVTGLTTAANIWVVAAIGMALGFGAYLDAVAATVLVVIVLAGLGSLESRLDRWRGRSPMDPHGRSANGPSPPGSTES